MMDKAKKILLLYSILALSIGILFGLFHYEYVFWQSVPSMPYVMNLPVPLNKTALLFYQKDNSWQEEKITVDIQDLQEALFVLVQHWLLFLQEENALPKTISLEATLVDISQNSLYISFDRSLFFEWASTYQKILIIVSLSKTVSSLQSSVQRYMLLVNHKPLIDNHIDCNVPFYISYWSTLY
jgi:hypothetical protein